MQLLSVNVRNFRSVDSALLTGLRQTNVLIGRNNVGKSSILAALELLATRTITDAALPDGVMPDGELAVDPAVEISATLDEAEHSDWIELAGRQLDPNRLDELRNTQFGRTWTAEYRATPERPNQFHPTRLTTLALDGSRVEVMSLTDSRESRDVNARMVDISQTVAQVWPPGAADFSLGGPRDAALRVSANLSSLGADPNEIGWIVNLFRAKLSAMFFFGAFRHAADRDRPVAGSDRLATSGDNLPEVLLTLLTTNRRSFDRVQGFLHSAIPGIGTLETPLVAGAARSYLGIRSPDERFLHHLHSVGGGIEQILLVATALETTGPEAAIFLDEPEGHLHPGAQRFILEQLARSGRQALISTHSSVFLDSPEVDRVYTVEMVDAKTTVRIAREGLDLQAAMSSIGVRLSDVLMSDGVLFVEGPSDVRALQAVADTCDIPLAARNIRLLPMGGGALAHREAPIRTDTLTAISGGTGVPHLFIIDRDERSGREIAGMIRASKGLLEVWSRREIENFVLVPSAIRRWMEVRYADSEPILSALTASTDEDIDQLIDRSADKLKGLVLAKRIRWRLGPVRGGVLTEDHVAALAVADPATLTALVESMVERRFVDLRGGIDVALVVEQELRSLDAQWKASGSRRHIAPGEEILRTLFDGFGGTFRKDSDTVGLAKSLTREEVDSELVGLLRRASELAIVAA